MNKTSKTLLVVALILSALFWCNLYKSLQPHYKAAECYIRPTVSKFEDSQLIMITRVDRAEYLYAYYTATYGAFVVNSNYPDHMRFKDLEEIYSVHMQCPNAPTEVVGGFGD